MLLLLLVIGGIFAFRRQRVTTAELRQAIAVQSAGAWRETSVMLETRHLKSAPLVSAESPAREDDLAAFARLRDEARVIQQYLSTRVSNSPEARPFPPRAWTNAGSALPTATLETIFWAASRGAVNVLQGLLVYEPETRAAAAAIFASLPPAVREQHPSWEHWVAACTAAAVPLYPMHFVGGSGNAERTKSLVKFYDEGPRREIELVMIDTPAGWRVQVPLAAIENYAAPHDARSSE